MKRLLSTALILSIAACSSTPTPAVQTAPAIAAAEPATTTQPAVAASPTAAAPEASDAGAPEVTTAPSADAGAAVTTATTTPPTTTTTSTTTAGGDPVVRGRAVFQRVCGRCHEDGEDEGPVPNLRWAEARMRTLVRTGNRRMRAIPAARLSDADLALVVAYLRSTHAIQ